MRFEQVEGGGTAVQVRLKIQYRDASQRRRAYEMDRQATDAGTGVVVALPALP